MTTEMLRSSDFLAMVDYDKGTVDRKMFSDQAIYEMELERIFARAWLFVGHESQVPNPNDFFVSRMRDLARLAGKGRVRADSVSQ